MQEFSKIAVLIDADNTPLDSLNLIFQEISSRGRVVLKRAYGNWAKDGLKKWEKEVKRLAIKLEQQTDYVAGKNATDIALVIDAMELLHSKVYDAFVIVSSDSDYTALSIKMKESGVTVIGVGRKVTPESFRNACDEFLLLENMSPAVKSQSSSTPAVSGDKTSAKGKKTKTSSADNTSENDSMNQVHELLKLAWNLNKDEDEYANVSASGSYIKRIRPDFDIRTYGFSKIPQLLDKYPEKYQTKRSKGQGKVTIISYRCLF